MVQSGKTNDIIKMRFPSMRTKKGEKYKNLNVLRIYRILANIEINRLRRLGRENEQNDLTRLANPDNIQETIARFIKPQIPGSPNYAKKSLLKLTRNLVDFTILPNDYAVLAKKMEKSTITDQEILDIFETDLFPHLNNLQGPDNESQEDRNIRITMAKVNLLSIMTARFLRLRAVLSFSAILRFVM